MLNKGKFIELLSGICDIYEKTPSEFMFGMYYEIFQNYEYSEVETAFKNCLRNRVYSTFPKPAEILEYLEGTKDDKALAAWLEARKACEDVGYYDSPQFTDPIISNCITELGGWQEFCSVTKEDHPFVEKRFLDLYRLFIKRGCGPMELVGFHNANNRLKGYHENVTQPILIGGEKVKELNQ